jgi:hypothetical protein
MIPFIWILLIIIISLVSFLFIYQLIYSREKLKSNEHQRLKYSIQPSIDIITKKLPYRLSIPSHYSHRISSNEGKINQVRSHSLANNLFVNRATSRRPSSIIDSKQISQIEFTLPPTAEKFRRRSVAICNNIIESKQSTINSIIKTIKSSNECLPCLVSFSIIYLKSAHIQIQFHSLSLNVPLQQLTIKVKLIPDGKMKSIEIKKIFQNENIFQNGNNDYLIQFSNILLTKLHDKAIIMKFYGKDQTRKTIQLGQIGKIYFNQFKNFQNENQLDFIHEIEIIKLVKKKNFSKHNYSCFFFLLIVFNRNPCFTRTN